MTMPESAVKKLSSRVRPGVFDVRASVFCPTSALISDDLPTLERPAKATSTPSAGGRPSIVGDAHHEAPGPREGEPPGFERGGAFGVVALVHGAQALASRGRPEAFPASGGVFFGGDFLAASSSRWRSPAHVGFLVVVIRGRRALAARQAAAAAAGWAACGGRCP